MQTEEAVVSAHIKTRDGTVGVGELEVVVRKPYEHYVFGKFTFPVYGVRKEATVGSLEGENLKAGMYALAQLDVDLVEAGFRLVRTGPWWFNRVYERP